MPIYSESIQNNEILNILGNKYKKVLIIGCGACMNESLAYLYDLPLSVNSEWNEYYPVPIIKELKRIAKMLGDKGYEVNYQYLSEGSNSRCMIDSTKEIYNVSLESKSEIVLVLSCPAGREGIKTTIKEIPVINITRQKGFLFYKYKTYLDGSRNIIKRNLKYFISIGRNCNVYLY